MKKFGGTIIFIVMLAVIILIFSSSLGLLSKQPEEIRYKEFLELVRDDKVAALQLQKDTVYGIYKNSEYSTDKDFFKKGKCDFFTVVPSVEQFSTDMAVLTAKLKGIDTDEVTTADYPFEYRVMVVSDVSFFTILTYSLPMILLVVLFIVMIRAQGGGKQMTNFSKSRAKVTMGNPDKITFANVAGAEEEKQELQEVVEFLRAPKRFIKMGARIPKGVLLVGPPGTGKTLLAKAAAGEANVPFFSISGSDFVEMFVGVGASRVRDLFATAKKCAPAIVFIDEIDAVGRQRGTGLGGGHDEREQTLNQLLVEMDGFVANEGIIVIAATNRADILDPALLRPGRFDRQIVVNYPDAEGREAILKVHAKGKPFADDVDLSVLAKRTPGFTGADLENVLNEAAILAARFSKDKITMDELEEAITRVMMGPEKKSRIITEEDKRITAYHESGHAIVSLKLKGCDPVHEVTIIPRGMANGYTMTLPDRESNHLTKCKLLDEIAMLLGGRAAEEIALPDISAGAYNDLQRASTLARRMVVEFGMSEEIGPVFLGGQTEVFIGKELGHTNNCSENMSAKIDAAIYRIIEEQYNRAKDIISSDMEALERVSNKLIEYERMTGDEFRKIYEGEELELVPYREKMEKREQERKEREESAKKENEPKQRRDADDLEALVRLREADGGIPKDGGSSGQ